MKTIVFHINVFLAGGIEKVLIDLLQALDPAKYRLKLSIGYNLQELEILKDRIPPNVEICYIIGGPKLTFAKKKKAAGNISAIAKIYGELVLPLFQKPVWKRRVQAIIQDADVIIDFDTTLAPYYGLLQGKKKIAYSHFSLAHYWGENANVARRDRLAKRLEHYDTIITICDEMKDEMASMYPALKNKLVRLYNALDFDKIKALSAMPDRSIFSLLPKEYFLSVGRLDETQKDTATLIKAYAAFVRKYNATMPLFIAGMGPDFDALSDLTVAEGINRQVIFIGYQSNPYYWMANAKLFLFSSKFEGLPTVLIEALSLGKPIIATACPTGVKEILMYGQAGILTQPGDISEFCEAINTLHNNTELQNGYITRSKSILGEFNISSVIKNFEALLS